MKFLNRSKPPGPGAALTGLVLVLMIGAGTWLRAEESTDHKAHTGAHDLYNPARTALINARLQLAQTFRQEQEIILQRQNVHRELERSLELLAAAENLDPSMIGPVEELRQRINKMGGDPCALQYDGDSLQRLYDDLLDDFEALIEHY